MIPVCILAIEDESDREYMTQLYLQYQRLMYSTINKITQDNWITEDVMQTSLEKLIDKIPLLKSFDRSRLVNYIISTCKNTAYNELNMIARQRVFGFDDCKNQNSSNEDTFEMERYLILKDDIESLVRIWPCLDARSRYLLEARYILEKSTKEIAIDLAIKPESVRMALTRARNKVYTMVNGAVGTNK